MDVCFFCPACYSEHDDPADARLGHRVLCLACAFEQDATAAGLEPNGSSIYNAGAAVAA